jgi:hypothetical protein
MIFNPQENVYAEPVYTCDYKENLNFLNDKQKILILRLGKYGIWFPKLLRNSLFVNYKFHSLQ